MINHESSFRYFRNKYPIAVIKTDKIIDIQNAITFGRKLFIGTSIV
jgi:hypothetical protein